MVASHHSHGANINTTINQNKYDTGPFNNYNVSRFIFMEDYVDSNNSHNR